MSKTNKKFLNTITLLLLNGVFWVGNIYPRHIIEITSLGFDFYSIFFNLLYHLIFFSFLVFFVSRNKTLFSEQAFVSFKTNFYSRYIVQLSALCMLQFLTDFIQIQFSPVTRGGMYLFNNIISVIYWLIVWKILAYKNETILKNKKHVFCMILFFAVIAGVFIVLDMDKLVQYNILYEKYSYFSTYATKKLINLDFIHTVENFVIDTLMGASLVFYFAFSYEKQKQKKTTHNSQKIITNDCIKKKRNKTVGLFITILRTGVLIALFFFMCWTDAIFFPEFSISDFNMQMSQSKRFAFDNTFDACITDITIFRKDRLGNDSVCYQTSKAEIYNNKQAKNTIKVSEIQTDKYDVLDNYIWNGKSLERTSNFKEYLLGSNVVYVFRNCAICYVDNDVPKIIEFDEIADSDENGVLIEICRQMISEGNFVAFEYSCDYLNKYDKKFLEPYINRYSKADFTSAEMEYMMILNYRPEYIQSVAKRKID